MKRYLDLHFPLCCPSSQLAMHGKLYGILGDVPQKEQSYRGCSSHSKTDLQQLQDEDDGGTCTRLPGLPKDWQTLAACHFCSLAKFPAFSLLLFFFVSTTVIRFLHANCTR